VFDILDSKFKSHGLCVPIKLFLSVVEVRTINYVWTRQKQKKEEQNVGFNIRAVKRLEKIEAV